MRFRGIAIAVLVAMLAACTGDDPGPARIDEAEALTAVVRWSAAHATSQGVAGDAGRPVVYVVSVDGSAYPSTVQAEVARTTVDDVDVRFADDLDQAVVPDDDRAPVRDDGILLLVGPIPEPAATIEIDVDIYRDNTRTDAVRFSVVASDDGATVTAVTARDDG